MRALAYAGYALLALAPLAFRQAAFTHDDVLKQALVATAALLILLRVLVPAVRARELEVRQDPTAIALALAWGAQALSLVGAVNPFEGYGPLVLSASCAVLYVCTVSGHVGRHFLRGVLPWMVIGAACLVAVNGLGQRAHIDLLSTDPARENPGAEPGSTLGGKTFAGEYLALVLPLAVAKIAAGRGWMARGAAAGAATLLLAHLLATGARGAWLGAAAGLLFFLGAATLRRCGPERRRAMPLAAVALLLAGALGIGVLAEAVGAADLRGRLRDTLHTPPGRDTLLVRRELWKSTLRLAGDHPVLGAGTGQYALAIGPYRSPEEMRVSGPGREPGNMAENDALQRLAETGALGFLAAALVAVTLVRKFAWYLRHQEEREPLLLCAGLLGGVAAVLVAGLFGNPLRQPAVAPLAWVFLGLAELAGNPRPRYRKRILTDAKITALLCVPLLLGFCVLRSWQLVAADAAFNRGLEAYVTARRTPGTEAERVARMEEACRLLKAAYEREPTRWQIPKVLGLAYLDRTQEKVDAGGDVDRIMLSEATGKLSDAMALNPNDAETWNAWGLAKRFEGKAEEGRLAFERAAALDPVSREPRLNLALACEQDGLPDRAVVLYEALLRDNAGDAEAHFGRGHALARLGQFARAAEAFTGAERGGYRHRGNAARAEVERLDTLRTFRESETGKAWLTSRSR